MGAVETPNTHVDALGEEQMNVQRYECRLHAAHVPWKKGREGRQAAHCLSYDFQLTSSTWLHASSLILHDKFPFT